MATGKYVYFAADGKWFENSQECDNHDLFLEVCGHIRSDKELDKIQDIEEIVIHLLKRYHVKQRYDHMIDGDDSADTEAR